MGYKGCFLLIVLIVLIDLIRQRKNNGLKALFFPVSGWRKEVVSFGEMEASSNNIYKTCTFQTI